MLCTNCGQPLAEGALFCGRCGTPTPTAQTPAAGPSQAPGAGPAAVSSMPAFAQAPPPPTFAQAPPPAAGGYGPGWQPHQMPPQMPPPKPPRRTGLIVGSIAAAVIVLAGLGLGLYFGLRGDDEPTTVSSKTTVTTADDDTTTSTGPTSTTEAVFAQAEGEIFLEPAGVAGPDSFTGETFVPAGPPSTLNIPTPKPPIIATSTTLPPATATTAPGATVQVVSYSGDTPALYGGSKNKQLVDKEGQLRFLEQNPDKAAAFCAALNADPTFRWSGGDQIQPAQLRDYFAELTPLMLTRDTRVTNHGFRDGKPTPRQSVLQKGQMVLVDLYGIPRVRCECGNPLAPPKPAKKTPTYTGPKWPDFDPTVIIVVQPTVVIIGGFVVIDIHTGETFVRPPGTEGAEDTVAEVTVWQLDVSQTYTDDDAHNFTVEWSGAVTLDPETGMLSGEGAGQWHVEGPYYEGSEVIGQMSGDGSFGVEFSGQAEDADTGRMLTIVPVMTGFSIDGQNWEGPDPEDAQPDFEGAIEGIIAMTFDMTVNLPATNEGPVFAELAVNGWTGGATLAPYEP